MTVASSRVDEDQILCQGRTYSVLLRHRYSHPCGHSYEHRTLVFEVFLFRDKEVQKARLPFLCLPTEANMKSRHIWFSEQKLMETGMATIH